MRQFMKGGVTVKLNPRQMKFAEYYAQCGNAAQAAVSAGYSKKYAAQNADKLLKNTNISEYIKQLTDAAQDARIITAKERQVILSDMARNGEYEAADRIRAIDTLNKMTGEYLLKVEADVDTSLTISIDYGDEDEAEDTG